MVPAVDGVGFAFFEQTLFEQTLQGNRAAALAVVDFEQCRGAFADVRLLVMVAGVFELIALLVRKVERECFWHCISEMRVLRPLRRLPGSGEAVAA